MLGITACNAVVAALTIVALTSGCSTQLSAIQVTSNTKSVAGQVYFLPRIDYVVSLDRELQKCTFDRANEVDSVLDWMRESADALSLVPDNRFLAGYHAIFADQVFSRREIVAGVYGRFFAAHPKALATYSPAKSASEAGILTGLGLENALCTLAGNQAVDDKASICKTPNILPNGAVNFAMAMRQLRIDEPTIQIEVEMAATITPNTTADPKHVYALQYSGMQHWMKGTDYSVEAYANGTLKAINVTLDDQTGAVIQSAISGAAKIAAATGGFPLAPTAAKVKINAKDEVQVESYDVWKKKYNAKLETQTPCTSDVRLKLLQRKALMAAIGTSNDTSLEQELLVTAAQAALAKAVEAYDAQKSIVDAIADDDKKKKTEQAKLKALEETTKSKKASLLAAQLAQEDGLEKAGKLQSKFKALRKSLTVNHTVAFPVELDKYVLEVDGVDQTIQKWFDKQRLENLCAPTAPGQSPCAKDPMDDVRMELRAQAALIPLLQKAQEVDRIENSSNVSVVYRQPASTLLLVCQKVDCLDKNNVLTAAEKYRVAASRVEIPQLGVLATLPLTNGPFQNNTLTASFSESGALTKVAYKTNAAAAKAASVFESSADSFMKFKEAKLKQETTKLTQSKEELEARTNLIKAQLDLEKAQADLDAYRKAQAKPEAGGAQ